MSNEEKILAILEEHSKQFELINKRFDEQEAKFIGKLNEQDSKFNSKFDEQEAKFNARFDEQEAKFNAKFDEQEAKFNNRFDKIDEKLESHDEDIKIMKASILNLEAYVMEKIPALFDAITVNSDKHEIYDEHIASLNAKTFNHNIRISALEDALRTLPA